MAEKPIAKTESVTAYTMYVADDTDDTVGSPKPEAKNFMQFRILEYA